MGVMPCYRNNCDNILCDTYIEDIGYICNECQSEFKQYLMDNNINLITEYEIREELKKFLKTNKITHQEMNNEISVDDFFKQHTRN